MTTADDCIPSDLTPTKAFMASASARTHLLPHPREPCRSTVAWMYILAVLLASLCASLSVFSLYSADLQEHLSLSPMQINVIATASAVGLYAPVPLIGHIADVSYLSVLGLSGGVFFFIGYGGASIIYQFGGPLAVLALCFSICGAATASIFLSLLIYCARIYPTSALLSISVPATSFGLSSILYAFVVPKILDSGCNTGRLFAYFAGLMLIVGITAGFIPIVCRVDRLPHHAEDVNGLSDGICPETDNSSCRELPHKDAKSHLARFIRTPNAWLLLITFLLVTGPLEMYINNMATIGVHLSPLPSTALQVRAFAVANTGSRLVAGVVVDAFKVRPSRVLISMIASLALVHAAFALHLVSGNTYVIASALSGYVYGSSFTLYPIIVSRVWGGACFASYWGMFVAAPAVGALLYGILLSADLEIADDYSHLFAISGVMLCLCFTVIVKLGYQWPGH